MVIHQLTIKFKVNTMDQSTETRIELHGMRKQWIFKSND